MGHSRAPESQPDRLQLPAPDRRVSDPDGSSLAGMTIEHEEDLAGLVRAGQVVAEAREVMVEAVTPGVSTGELDAVARDVFRRYGARSAPIVTYRFPGATCISVNDEAAHGIPSFTRQTTPRRYREPRVSIELDGYFSDTGISVPVGDVTPTARRLLDATRLAQAEAMAAAQPGSRLRDIARAVQRRARQQGFRVIRNLNGHGIGRGLHEEPSVPSIDEGQRSILQEGLVLAIEPFLSVTANEVVEGNDGWTLRTSDGSLVAQFEHTVVVTHNGPMVLTA